jgi:hypothetical protein
MQRNLTDLHEYNLREDENAVGCQAYCRHVSASTQNKIFTFRDSI